MAEIAAATWAMLLAAMIVKSTSGARGTWRVDHLIIDLDRVRISEAPACVAFGDIEHRLPKGRRRQRRDGSARADGLEGARRAEDFRPR